MVAPQDNLIVELDKAFENTIGFDSGVVLFKDTSLNPEWHTTVVGKVVSVPHKLSKIKYEKNDGREVPRQRLEYSGLEIEVSPGDEILFSYMVVFDGEIRDRDSQTHENLIYHEGKWLWKVDYMHYLGKIVDGELIPAQGYAFVEKVTTDTAALMASGLWLPEMSRKKEQTGLVKILSIGKNKTTHPKLDAKAGDIIRVNERVLCKYEVKGKLIWVIDQSYVFGKAE